MTTLREAAQQALEALGSSLYPQPRQVAAIAALRAALAEPTVPSDCTDSHQPVAWYHVPHPGNGISPVVSMFQQREPSLYGAVVPLYTAPPQRKPLTLTDLQEALVYTNLIDRDAIEDPDGYDEGSTLAQIDELHRAIERAHGIGVEE